MALQGWKTSMPTDTGIAGADRVGAGGLPSSIFALSFGLQGRIRTRDKPLARVPFSPRACALECNVRQRSCLAFHGGEA
jgi:hypothetical protein